MHESYLKLGGYRYLKASLALVGASLLVYEFLSPPGGARGGTWVGVGLGALSAALILWLTWFGARKRSYRAGGVMLREWLSAHVYFGLALVVLVPLHCAFQFGWNVHTLAYALMCLVVVSGITGVLLYGTTPRAMTENRSGEKLALLIVQVANIDSDCRETVQALPDRFTEMVRQSISETRIGGGLREQLSGRRMLSGTRAALTRVRELARDAAAEHRDEVTKLLGLLALKQELLERIGRDLRYKALLDVWLLVHVPAALATVAAVAVHVVAVFYYR